MEVKRARFVVFFSRQTRPSLDDGDDVNKDDDINDDDNNLIRDFTDAMEIKITTIIAGAVVREMYSVDDDSDMSGNA